MTADYIGGFKMFGDYDHPIMYVWKMYCSKDRWYTDGESMYQCIESGQPDGIDDTKHLKKID